MCFFLCWIDFDALYANTYKFFRVLIGYITGLKSSSKSRTEKFKDGPTKVATHDIGNR